MKDEIRVIIKEPMEEANECCMANELEAFQKVVGGYIETVALGNRILMICNEEGKLNGLDPNILMESEIIVGKVVFASFDDEGNFTSLTDEQVKAIEAFLLYRAL